MAWHLGTGTDTNTIQLTGAATALTSIPNRYVHTASGVVCLDDVKNIIILVIEFIRSAIEADTFIPI